MSTKLKCLLLDDEIPGLTYLKMLCEQIPELEIVKVFNRSDLFLAELPKLQFDLCIMDIEMPYLNGLQLANLLNGKPVIFTTAFKKYASEAFDLDVIDFVSKPIKIERLQKAVQKAMMQINNSKYIKKFVQLNTDKGKSIIFFDQLTYIKTSEIDSRDKIAYLKDGTKIQLKNIPFEKLLDLLPENQFCRINKQEIISVDIVQVFSFNEITSRILTKEGNPVIFYLSEVYRSTFLTRLKM